MARSDTQKRPSESREKSGTDQITILVKAAPHPSKKYKEIVCTAGVTTDHRWFRLFPIQFRFLKDGQKFNRWDVIEYRWHKPSNDKRVESRHVDQSSIKIIGSVPEQHRFGLIEPMLTTSLRKEREEGKSFALIRPRNLRFKVHHKDSEAVRKEKDDFQSFAQQISLFGDDAPPYSPCPYRFTYSYDTDDGSYQGTCQDWEIEGTFFKWRRTYGEERALQNIRHRWGEEFLERDIAFAMGTHHRWEDTWLINGIIQLPAVRQPSLF